ncbi:Clp protease adaptor protein ClpS [Dissulfurispira thermophila]|uniref:Clp protease adaptor protein ClpS n=2 Tax=root TaxID=1 RepID=A0A7G1H0I0_9BACT|nr:ATP-dependent Clp protease adaptor ClpS [Dissulfurispira thermophila]BCB95601.1 Clp protease adaptor protein ClpS [Dissulfurispira thermophila]
MIYIIREPETFVADYTSIFVIEPWNVILLNDDWHTFDEVIIQIVKAIKCSPQKALDIALEAHTKGEAVCYSGPRERCEHVASILEEIELGVKIERAV